MVMPARPAPGLVFVQPHVALLSLELRFNAPPVNAPPGTAHVRQGLQGSAFWGVGQVVARLAAVQVTSPDGPDHLTGLAPLGYPHPLGAETVGAGPLGSLRHRYLPPGLLRQFITALLHGPALPIPQLGFAGVPVSSNLKTCKSSKLELTHQEISGIIRADRLEVSGGLLKVGDVKEIHEMKGAGCGIWEVARELGDDSASWAGRGGCA